MEIWMMYVKSAMVRIVTVEVVDIEEGNTCSHAVRAMVFARIAEKACGFR